MKRTQFLSRIIILMLVLIMLGGIAVSTTLAATRPYLNVIPVWSPTEELTSISGDDRFVELQLWVQGNAQFWALDLSCKIGRGTELATPTVVWGPDWGQHQTQNPADPDFFVFPSPIGSYDSDTGTFEATASRVGSSNAPMGTNGQEYTQLLATLTMQVNDLDRDAIVSVTCRTLSFLDRNGKLAIRGRLTGATRLQIRIGYTLEGTVLQQGARTHAGIDVTCMRPPTQTSMTFTDARGKFSFGGARTKADNPLRDQGLYECSFSSPTGVFLDSVVSLNLRTANYFLLPATLKAGDFDGPDGDVDVSDIAILTFNWDQVVTAFTAGDANGDTRVNEGDLAIVASNVDLVEDVPADHVIYSLGRDFDAVFPNGKIWWGDSVAGPVQALVPRSRYRDFWAQMSPDGGAVVYTSLVSRAGVDQHHLFTADTARGTARQFTPTRGFEWDALAPSWSPNSERIAFICSWQDAISGYEYNEGNLCVANAADSNNRAKSLTVVDTDVKIFPPAWFNSNVLIYAGLADHDTCPNTLCFHDFATNTSGKVSGILDFGANDIVEMPVVINYHDGTNYLFYRFYDSGATMNHLRVATATYAAGSFGGGVAGAIGSGIHEEVGVGGSTDYVDYYDVSPMLDIMLYHFDHPGFSDNLFLSIRYDTTRALNDNWRTAGLATFHTVDGYLGSPTAALGGFGAKWDGSLNTPTELHAHRASFDWVP